MRIAFAAIILLPLVTLSAEQDFSEISRAAERRQPTTRARPHDVQSEARSPHAQERRVVRHHREDHAEGEVNTTPVIVVPQQSNPN